MDVLKRFPRSHLVLATLVAMPLTSFLVASPSPQGGDRFTTELVLAEIDAGTHALDLDTTDPEPSATVREHREVVRSGDSLERIFQRASISRQQLAAVMASGPAATGLKRIYPGNELTFTIGPDERLVRLAYAPNRLESVVFDRNGDQFVGRTVHREPERVRSYREGTIQQSLFLTSTQMGLDDDITIRLAQIFQWDIDFVLDIRKGDSFHVLFEELYLDDEFLGFGNILAAEFVNQGKRYRAVRYTDANGHADFFAPNGDSMRKAFLRAPVDFTRISSNFNMRRLHPLYKTTRPHRGIDYAAPSGTPVLASGDGRVKIASRNASNGNFVVVQHGEQFQTKYLHLSKFGRGIKGGTRVRQGQIIGYVGATGWATGPHLHYEFLVGGVHKNPRTVPLPKANPVPEGERQRFDIEASALLALLDDQREDVQVALNR